MKDLLNYDISTKPESAGVRYRMQHRSRDGLHMEFTTPRTVFAEQIPTLVKSVMRNWTNKYAKAVRKTLSPKQKKYYDAIIWFYKEEGRAPSYEEQCDLMGWKSKGTPFYFAKRLVALGWFWLDEDGRIVPYDVASPEDME